MRTAKQQCESCHEETRNPLVWHGERSTVDYRVEEYRILLCNTCFDRRSALKALELSSIENGVGNIRYA